jgi:hypothetical protein
MATDTKDPGLLKETVDQFEKVMSLERRLLQKSIEKLTAQHEELQADLTCREEALLVWERAIQTERDSNSKKLQLAKKQYEASKSRTGPKAPAASLGQITEGDEEEEDEDAEEEDEDPVVRALMPQAEEVARLEERVKQAYRSMQNLR